jgi:hypothetical protein
MKFGRVGPPALRKGGGDMPERSISGRIDRRFDASFNPLSSKPGKLETNIIPDMIKVRWQNRAFKPTSYKGVSSKKSLSDSNQNDFSLLELWGLRHLRG